MKTARDPNQGTLLVADPAEHGLVVNPAALESAPELPAYDRTKVDPNPGLSTPVVDGLTMLHAVLTEIARERSNRGFVQLSESAQPVRKFASRVATTASEARELVDESAGKKYRHAQLRINIFHGRQMARARAYNNVHRIVADSVLANLCRRTWEVLNTGSFMPIRKKKKTTKRESVVPLPALWRDTAGSL